MKKNRFVAIDFEKLDTIPCSVCSIGGAVIENGKITKTFHVLVCPPSKNENYHCVKTHGIHYSDVKRSPKFDVVWKEVDKLIDGAPIIAHNFGVERGCINACNEYYGTDYSYEYICTLSLARKYMKDLPKRGLDLVCEALDYKMGRHHNAKDDAIAAAEAFLRIKKKYNLKYDDIERRQQFD